MTVICQHRQIGKGIILIFLLSMLGTLFLTLQSGMVWLPLALLLCLGVILVIFSSLTITLTQEALSFSFNLNFLHTQIPLQQIHSMQVVRNPWFYGWGVHWTSRGWVYNVSGFEAVEIKLRSGRRFRLGSDEAEALVKAWQTACQGR